ncbi:hypothetical protein GCM10010411_76190 [Actinomadura fulvescens]|uniref:Uncharacterized protein n=1 Tax=Actinomadura fulvescens TaxID=46160 RepID=A0ABP6CT36_9ACTN
MARRPPRFKLVLRNEITQDINQLPSARLKQIVLWRIESLVTDEERGPPLERKLADLRRLYVDTEPQLARWRIVYRYKPRPTGESLPIVEIVAIGPRKDSEVYRWAAERLGRIQRIEPEIEIDPVLAKAKELDKAANQERQAAKSCERDAQSRQAAIDRGKGPAVKAIRALGGASPQALQDAEEADVKALAAVRDKAQQHRSTARQLREAARKLREDHAVEQATTPSSEHNQSQEQHQEPYDPLPGTDDLPGPSRSL